jgi:hypothetical protein
MIEFGYPAEQPPGSGSPPDPGRRRTLSWLGIAAAVVLVLVVALLIGRHGGGGPQDGTAAGTTASRLPAPGQTSGPGQSGQNGQSTPGQGGGNADLPAVVCPDIRDEQSHLAYRCIDDYLVQDGSDAYLGLRISLNHEVEPGWIISEGSGNPASLASPPDNTVVGFRTVPAATSTAVQAEVRRRAGLALAKAYGDSPSTRTLSARSRNFAGVAGYELCTEVTINPVYRATRGLEVRTERLWVVGLPTKAGISIFMMSIPDQRADLWRTAESTVGTVHVI